MTDQDLLEKIKKSAEQINIPDTIAPEHITSKLKTKNRMPRLYHFSIKSVSSAAAILLLCGTLWGTAWNANIIPSSPDIPDTSKKSETAAILDEEDTSLQTDFSDMPKQNAGSLYTVASSYDQIYNMLESSYSFKDVSYYTDGAAAEGIAESAVEDISQKRSSAAAKESDSYSSTNLQTEGVDESDMIKTDGRYIYTVRDRKVLITDTANDDLRHIASIQPDLDSADSVLELYVDQDTLILLAEHYNTSLEESSAEAYYSESVTEDTSSDSGFLPLEGCDKISSISTDCSAIVYVYDISNPADPLLKGTSSQDGLYQTSRKIGDILYLFTRKERLASPSAYAESRGKIIPCVNGEEIAYDHVYLPDEGNNGLIISSIRLDKPEETLDKIMIVHNYADIYVGNDSLYLYHSKYQDPASLTQIAKFSIKNGMINAVNAASVKGEIYDTFAINEYQNTLRVLTTSYDKNGISSNRLYTFDETLKQTGLLENIAEGEEIYAARYFGSTAYFITYRNTDPLFAVDVSDISDPKILGELEITGFSEYLHFWENDKLLGIGYETDPNTGQTKGLKLVMFDISDPAELKILDSLVLNDYYYSPALYDYKCVLADPGQNMIGFVAECNPNEDVYYTDYAVYSWNNGHFTTKLNERLSKVISADFIRGIYINDTFYIADILGITSFDMKNNFQKQKQLTF